MNRLFVAAVAAAIAASTLTSPGFAQGAAQTVTAVDVKALSTGYRSSKIVGSTVVNDRNETVGKIDDLIISRDRGAPYAVVSVGGFLGMGTRLVVIPYASLKPTADNKGFILPGVTKEQLKAMPEFSYQS